METSSFAFWVGKVFNYVRRNENVIILKKMLQLFKIIYLKGSVFIPNFHLTYGIGEPTATQVNVRFAPSITSFNGSGGTENCGGTRRTFTYNDVGFECSVPTEFSATHSYFPWSSVMLLSIWRLPVMIANTQETHLISDRFKSL